LPGAYPTSVAPQSTEPAGTTHSHGWTRNVETSDLGLGCVPMTSPTKKPITNRELVHQAIDDLNDDEVEIFYKIFTERRKHEEPGLALRHAFIEVYRARRSAASASD
jgi:hypothetical protein